MRRMLSSFLFLVAGAALILAWPGIRLSQDILAAGTAGDATLGGASVRAPYFPEVCEHLTDAKVGNKAIYKKCLRGGSSSGIAKADFNGDGFGDLAIGMPRENLQNNSVQDAGAVVVIYGTSTGLNAADGSGVPVSQFWSQGAAGVPGSPEANDLFGSALAAGDFNGDGFSDLAIGVPGEDVRISGADFPNTGGVNVIYGSANGLSATDPATPPQFWSVGNFDFVFNGIETLSHDDSHFGAALAWGDFDHDGFGDLAIGIPDQDFCLPVFGGCDFIPSAGAVVIIHGSSTGLTSSVSQFWSQGPLQDGRENDDHFGATLAGGDFNGDGFSDLAVGVPSENIGSIADAGAVNVIYGSSGGLTTSGNQFWNKDSTGIIDFAASGQQFGRALATGDFNGDGKTDLAVGVPFHKLGLASGAGSVNVIYGSSNRLAATGNQILTQGELFISTVEAPEAGDNFGLALAAGDFNGDGKADLAIGVPNEDVKSALVTNLPVVDAGEVNVVYGSSTGLSRTAGPGAQIWHQEKLGAGLEAGDRFGSALTAWNFGRNHLVRVPFPPRLVATADLAIGVPFEDVLAPGSTDPTQQVADAGAVHVIYGSVVGGLSVSGGSTGSGSSQLWIQGHDGVPGGAEAGDMFGAALY